MYLGYNPSFRENETVKAIVISDRIELILN